MGDRNGPDGLSKIASNAVLIARIIGVADRRDHTMTLHMDQA